MTKHKVAILLSTFNGERYLKEQIESLLNQTYSDIVIYIRDDGSTDSTVNILTDFSDQENRIIISKDEFGNVGVAKSFRILMETAHSDYYLFADQDDLWDLNKIETLMRIAEKSNSQNEPYLLFSNMVVFNENTGTDYNFFKKFKIDSDKIRNGLFQGEVSGCLMLFNDKSKQVSLKLNSNSNMLHDWDILMSCYLFGEIELLDEKLIKHRLHNSNVIGEFSNKPISTLLKDLGKYLFKSNEYRKIQLKYYFDYIKLCVQNIDDKVRLEKDLLNEEEINELSLLRRKKWYLKHFNPFVFGKVRGLLILLTV